MKRYTYFDGGKWRLKIGDTEYSGDWVDRLAAYEETRLEPEDMKKAFNEDATLKLAGQILGVTPGRSASWRRRTKRSATDTRRCTRTRSR